MSSATELLLDVRDLSVVFDTDDGVLTAVDGVSFGIRPGEVVGLVGESGCGKSVTSMCIPRLIPSPPGRIAGGEIHFQGHNLLDLPIAEMRRLRGTEIGVVFQEPMTALSPLHRVGRQLVEAIQLHEAVPRREAWERSMEWLGKVGIPDPAQRMMDYPFELSGGMRQRVMIAMALILNPKLVIADEPTTALDVTIQAQILALMRQLQTEFDMAILLITHDLGVVAQMADDVAVMYMGRIVEFGTVKKIFADPQHPYTIALMRSLPGLGVERKSRLQVIEGSVPDPFQRLEGCPFHPRCTEAEAGRCDRGGRPPLIEIEEGHHSACLKRHPEEATGA